MLFRFYYYIFVLFISFSLRRITMPMMMMINLMFFFFFLVYYCCCCCRFFLFFTVLFFIYKLLFLFFPSRLKFLLFFRRFLKYKKCIFHFSEMVPDSRQQYEKMKLISYWSIFFFDLNQLKKKICLWSSSKETTYFWTSKLSNKI